MNFEIWQVLFCMVLDNIIVADSLEEAQWFAEETFIKSMDVEKDMFDVAEKTRKEEEEAAREDEDNI